MSEGMTDEGRRARGMRTRREVLGDAHVDRAEARKDEFTADFQDMITRYAWGEIWTRPGLDRKTRSCITLTAMVAGGHLEELAMHVRAALRNGLTPTRSRRCSCRRRSIVEYPPRTRPSPSPSGYSPSRSDGREPGRRGHVTGHRAERARPVSVAAR